ncbi:MULTISPECIES: SDR family NAD(P)-dependent oxidoreductase [unclassified Pseudofrankia]|uniref:SDR family NAD(P)-dependent oxidoreductase n=1 Tax=unclassified Pseudofrankia TaxID=2994372 RepID=UPI0008D914E8|nr:MULTISPECIES: SDR family NAD(P)-dependent oxidoreductase [unclassified Pseudofrankia]MDT3446907.1 SDR family NAD(P)-dependent oxidoreductase [Pseudofrankia sp. BMG5.37]OHV49049.1 short-chain dehydrogenase [Pseudofrankia sp. BMG5.36]
MTASKVPARLVGRRVLVTGGGSGIGRASVLRLAAEGAAVAVTDLRAESAEAAAEEVARGGGHAVGLPADVADEQSVAAAVRAAAGQFGGLDTVVACAGLLHSAATHETSLDLWEFMLRVNLTGTFLTVKHCLPHLLTAGGGSIVTVGSVASLVAGGWASCYDASKGGVLQFTRAVGAEYADRGIRANCVCPGHIGTNLRAHSTAAVGPPATPPVSRVTAPMNRRADPAEVAGVIAFLCSDDSSFMTSSAVMVDGGFTAV